MRVGIVGCGAVADYHLAALRALPGAVCTVLHDAQRPRAEAAKARHGLDADIVDRLEDVAARADLVVLAVPNAFHAEYSLSLLRAGVHVLCEKPLATTAADAREMVRTGEQTGRVLACGLVRRFFGATELVRDALRRGLVGAPLRCTVRESLYGWPLSRAVFDRELAGGGALIDTGPHVLDMASTLLGQLRLRHYADDARGGVEANASLEAESESPGGLVPVTISLSRGVPIKNTWRIDCEEGFIEFSPHQPNAITLTFTRGGEPYATTAEAAPGNPFRRQLENVIAAIRGEASLVVSGADALPGVELIEACYQAREAEPEPWTPAGTAAAVRVKESVGKKVLLTGAAGKVGSRLVELWAAEGQLDRLRCMVRGYNNAQTLLRFPLEVVEGDLLDAAAVRRAVQGCDAVLHFGAGEKPGAETQTVLDAAREFGVRRVVHVSSACVYGLGLPERIETLQEATPLSRTGELYADGKAEAERVVQRAVRQGAPVVMLRPQVVYGPGMRWTAELMTLLAANELCVVQDGGWANLIYVDDLVAAASRALESERGVGQAYFITDGEPVRWRDYLRAHAALVDTDLPELPRAALLSEGGGLRAWLRESLQPLGPVVRSPEFREFVVKSPLMQATAFRAYLALRENPKARARLERLKNGSGAGGDAPPRYNEHWIRLQLSEARLSARQAERDLGFRARVPFAEALQRSAAWLARYGLAPAPVQPSEVLEAGAVESLVTA